PGPVSLTGLQDGTCRTSGIATTLELDAVELGLARIPVVFEDLVEHHVARSMLNHLERTGADRLQVVGAVASSLAHVVTEEMLRQNQAVITPERIEPQWIRLLERDLHGVVIDGFHQLDVLVDAKCRRGVA